MRTLTNRISLTAIWLLTAVLLIHLCAPLVYQCSIDQIREEQSTLLNSDEGKKEMQTLVLDISEFEAEYFADGEELEIGDMRYDVAGYDRIGNKVYCRVIADQREAQLLIKQRKQFPEKEKISTRFAFWCPDFCQSPDKFQVTRHMGPGFCYEKPVDDSQKCNVPDNEESPPPEGHSSSRLHIS